MHAQLFISCNKSVTIYYLIIIIRCILFMLTIKSRPWVMLGWAPESSNDPIPGTSCLLHHGMIFFTVPCSIWNCGHTFHQ